MPKTHDIHIPAPRRSSVPTAPRRTLDAATVLRVLPRAMRDALDARMRPLQSALDDLGAALDRLDSSVDRAVASRQRLADARSRALQPRPAHLPSATSGYVRDAAGNRIRPMTPADLNAIADKHYGRVR